jgi:hypothetical protein
MVLPFSPWFERPGGGRQLVFLQATLDDASRLIPHAQFYANHSGLAKTRLGKTEFTGGHTSMAFDCPRKVALIGKSCPRRNLGDG